MKIELKPCPFCGNTESLVLANTHTAKFWVECDEDFDGCSAEIHGEWFDGPQREDNFSLEHDGPINPDTAARIKELHSEYQAAAESAISAWNHRAGES